MLRLLLLLSASLSVFGQRVYPSGPRTLFRVPNGLELSDSQLRQLAQGRKDQLSAVLGESQKARLAELQEAVQPAGEAVGLGLLESRWKISCQCNDHAVIKALGIDNTQRDRLRRLHDSAVKAEQKLSEKQQQLDTLIQAESDDVALAGQLTLDIARLRKQTPDAPATLRAATALLNEAQQTKLHRLEEAVMAVRQAANLGLIDNPWQGEVGECLCN
jgi:hypothetical protein